MRGPRLSFPEEFRDSWDKENKDPVTQKFSPKTKRSRAEVALQEITLPVEQKRVNWLDTLLNAQYHSK